MLALLFSLSGSCRSVVFVKWKQGMNGKGEEEDNDKAWGTAEQREEKDEDEREEERERKKAVKLIFCAEPCTATDMLRQKPRPGEAAWVWLMNKVKVSEVYYAN